MPGGISTDDNHVYFAATLQKSLSILGGANPGRPAFFGSRAIAANYQSCNNAHVSKYYLPTVILVSGSLYLYCMIIDCSTCTMAAIACNTCVVSFFLDNTSQISDETVGALTVLAESGLTPPLQFNARTA